MKTYAKVPHPRLPDGAGEPDVALDGRGQGREIGLGQHGRRGRAAQATFDVAFVCGAVSDPSGAVLLGVDR